MHLSDIERQAQLLRQKVYHQQLLTRLQYSRNLEKQLIKTLETWKYNLERPELIQITDVINRYAQELEIVLAMLPHLVQSAPKAEKDSLRTSLRHLRREYLLKLLEEPLTGVG